IGRIKRGRVRPNQEVVVMYGDENRGKAKVSQILTFKGLERSPAESAEAGDIVLIAGVDQVNIGVTICDPERLEGLPPIAVDEPTRTLPFMANTPPLAGREGKSVTGRQIRERLEKELLRNVALRVQYTNDSDVFEVSGRGELHLPILL